MNESVVHQFSRQGHKIEIIEQKRSIPGVSSFEDRLGIEVRYGLRFNGHITNWSDFVEALEDVESAIKLAKLGEMRAKQLGQSEDSVSESAPE